MLSFKGRRISHVNDDGDPYQVTFGTEDAGRARIYYDAIDTFEIKIGLTDNGGLYLLLFRLPARSCLDWMTQQQQIPPAANFTWSTRRFNCQLQPMLKLIHRNSHHYP